MIKQEDVDRFMEEITEENGNVIFLEEIYTEPEPVVPDFFSIIKAVLGCGK